MSEPAPEYHDGSPVATAPRPIDVAEVGFFRQDPVDIMAVWREAAADALAQRVERGLFQLGDTLVLGGEIKSACRIEHGSEYPRVVLDSVEGAAQVEVVRPPSVTSTDASTWTEHELVETPSGERRVVERRVTR